MKQMICFFKKNFFYLCLAALFLSMLCFPSPVFNGAKRGLLLWFHSVLPTLFPFIFLCTFLILSGGFRVLSGICAPLLCRFFGVSFDGSFAVLTGFLCGYPTGGKVAATLYQTGCISLSEATYLLSFCNNTSPVFLMSFVILQNLGEERLLLPSLIIAVFSPVFCSFIFRPKKNIPVSFDFPQKGRNTFSSNLSASSALDAAVSQSLDAIVKVGGYIILFCVLSELFSALPFSDFPLASVAASALEITNGISSVSQMPVSFEIKYILCMSLTSFGGWCAVSQTMSMITGTAMRIGPYIIQKLITASVTSFLSYLYISLIY